MQNKNQEPEQYFVAVPVSSGELPDTAFKTGEHHQSEVVVIECENGDKLQAYYEFYEKEWHSLEYGQSLNSEVVSWLKPLSLAQMDKEVAAKAWDAAINFAGYHYDTHYATKEPLNKTEYIQSLK